MAVDYSNSGSYIKNYSSTNSDFLSRISTITFYDILDTSLGNAYSDLLDKVSNITVEPVITVDGSLKSMDTVISDMDASIRKNATDIESLKK